MIIIFTLRQTVTKLSSHKLKKFNWKKFMVQVSLKIMEIKTATNWLARRSKLSKWKISNPRTNPLSQQLIRSLCAVPATTLAKTVLWPTNHQTWWTSIKTIRDSSSSRLSQSNRRETIENPYAWTYQACLVINRTCLTSQICEWQISRISKRTIAYHKSLSFICKTITCKRAKRFHLCRCCQSETKTQRTFTSQEMNQ